VSFQQPDRLNKKEVARMAEKSKFSINIRPRFGDEYRATGAVSDLTYHIWVREAYLAYTRHLGLEAPANSWDIPLRIEAMYTTPLQMTEEAKVYTRTTRIGVPASLYSLR